MMTVAKKAKAWFKKSASGWKANCFIIGAIICKSFADYAIVWGLMDYITDIWHKNVGFAAATINVKEGLDSLMTIVAIFLSDAYVARYFLLLVVITLYAYGLLVFSFSVPRNIPLFYVALVLLAAGEGGMECTLRKFGAHQFVGIENEKSAVRPSRICWYAGCFAGSALGIITNGFIFSDNSDERQWIIGGFISTGLMGVAFYSIAAGTLLYKIVKPHHNPFKRMLHVLVIAIPKRRADDQGLDEGNKVWGRWYLEEGGPRRSAGESQGRKEGLGAESNIACNKMVPKLHEIQIRDGNSMPTSDDEYSITINANDDTRDDQCRCQELDRAARIIENITSDQSAEAREESVLPPQKPMEVDAARPFLSLLRFSTTIGLFPIWTALGLFPIWTTFLIYGMVLSMGETFFLEQASSMDLRVGHGYELPLTFLIAVSALSRIFVSQACLPLLSWATGLKQGIPPTIRIGAGQILATLCCFTASLVESERVKAVKNKKFLPVNADDPTIAMSVFWLVPQYALSGAMNGLLNDGISDFFVDQVPNPLRACKPIFSESIICVGRFLSALAIVATSKLSQVGGRQSWFASDINRCPLDDYYKTVAFLSLVNLCFHLYFAKRYQWNMTTSAEGTETADELLLNELKEEVMKAQREDQRRRQKDDETDALNG